MEKKNNNLKQSCKNDFKNQSTNKGSQFWQYVGGICACISMCSWGACQTWSSPAIPYLTGNNSLFPVTNEQGAWIVSIYYVGDFIGAILNPMFIDRIGRKNTLLLSALPGIIGWIMIMFATNHVHLLVARIIHGIGQGNTYNSLVIYLSEISEKNIRGILVNMIIVFNWFGSFLCTTIAAFTSYEILNILSAALVIIFILTWPLLPETPYYNLLRLRDKDALQCLMKLRKISDPVKLDLEIREMKVTIEEQKLRYGLRELLNNRNNRRSLMVMFCMKISQMMTGVTPINAYAQEIFNYSNLSMDAGIQVIVLNGFSLLASLFTNVVIERFKRRSLFLSTSLICSLCLLTVGLLFFMDHYLKMDLTLIKWLPLLVFIIFQVTYVVGIGNVPYIIQGEIFPVNVKGAAVSCGMVVGSTSIFVTTVGYKFLSNAAGVYATFWLFAILCLIFSLLTFTIMPETKGMTLEDILALQDPQVKKKLETERRKC